MKPEIKGIVEALRKMKGGVAADNRPKGVPDPATNADTAAVEGQYQEEGTSDPGIQNMVTGNGGGPIIGRRARGSSGRRC